MSRLALISDIHGNRVALDAVIADAASEHVDEIICLGDIAAGGPQPREVIGRLRELGCGAVRGNGEGWLLEGLPPGRSEETRRLAEVVRWARYRLTAADLDYLTALPVTLTASVGGLTLLCFHGSPRSDTERLLATTSDEELKEAFADAPPAPIFAGGHTHLQLLRRCGQHLLLNPGSVGLPLGSLRGAPPRLPTWAEYATIEVKDGHVDVAFKRLGVDVEALAAATAAMPHQSWAGDLERRIRRWNSRATKASGPESVSAADSSAVSLRTATAADVPKLTELVEAAYGHYAERIGRPPRPMGDDYAEVVRSRQVTVAEREGELVGLIAVGVDADRFIIDNVAVAPSQQGRGTGRTLLEWAEAEAERAGFDSIHLDTHERMTENLAFYSRLGYVEYDRRRSGEGSVVYLRKELRAAAEDPISFSTWSRSRTAPETGSARASRALAPEMTGAVLKRRRAAAAAAWNLDDGVVLVAAGEEIPVPGRGDRSYPFRAHSEYLYLTDRERPGGVLAYAPGDGWAEFLSPVTADELLWSGLEGDREGVPEGTRPLEELEAWVHGRPVRWLGARAAADVELRDALIHVRRPKDDLELARMRKAAEATRAGFAELVPQIEVGHTERELQVGLEAAFLRNGGDSLAFETIVAAGDHAAVLHFSPTTRALRQGDLLLVDAGAEHRGYASDVTRTYAVGGAFSAEQSLVYDTVRRAGESAIRACRPGMEWHDVHRTAALVVAEGLVELGVLRGSPESLVESGAATLFFPHGVGHLVGLGIRDTGPASDEQPTEIPGLPRLRIDIVLRPRQTWTIEPGIYVVPALLAREYGHDGVDWDRVDGFRGFGGVRLEQNVLITDDACEVLTAAIPI